MKVQSLLWQFRLIKRFEKMSWKRKEIAFQMSEMLFSAIFTTAGMAFWSCPRNLHSLRHKLGDMLQKVKICIFLGYLYYGWKKNVIFKMTWNSQKCF